jgi:error-prone DNA polymerase
MVISTRPLIDLVPVQPAAMAGRHICQWDKDSCGDAGFLNIDLLGLGMLSAVEDCIDRIARLHAEPIDLSRIPLDDPQSVRGDPAGRHGRRLPDRGRAVQACCRLRPGNLDDLTVQVALVRPGSIQQKAVHPYVKHRPHAKRADPSFEPPSRARCLREALRDTLGVVVFQDQVLDVAMAAAGFSIGEARRGYAADEQGSAARRRSRRSGRGSSSCLSNGIDERTAHAIYDKLVGFAGFGFPKSHAAPFGLLAYQSAWLRRYYPAEFLCALLNAQPMGFYPPASLVRDAQRRGVEVLPPHINLSLAQCALEDGAVRVGLGYVQAVGESDAEAVEGGQPYAGLGELARRSAVKQSALESLVAAGAMRRVGSAATAAVAARWDRARRDGRRRQPAARTAARADVGDSGPARADVVGADARRLQAHVDLGRHASARAAATASACRRCHDGRLSRDAARHAAPGGGDGDRAAASRDRAASPYAARGRVRPGEPDCRRRSTSSTAR